MAPLYTTWCLKSETVVQLQGDGARGRSIEGRKQYLYTANCVGLGTMYCPNCGIENAVDAETCVSCGQDLRVPAERDPYANRPGPPAYAPLPAPLPHQQPHQAPSPGRQVPNYLVQSIALAVLGTCCWILPTALAIPAIVFGSQVNSRLATGDSMGAAEASRNARIWCWVSFASVLLIALAWGVFAMLVAVS